MRVVQISTQSDNTNYKVKKSSNSEIINFEKS